jgi:hypothetical protein
MICTVHDHLWRRPRPLDRYSNMVAEGVERVSNGVGEPDQNLATKQWCSDVQQ